MSNTKIHELKTWRDVFRAAKSGAKTAEYRKNDRNFKVGDHLNLREWDETKGDYTGESLMVRVNHIIFGGPFGIPIGFCVMSVEKEG